MAVISDAEKSWMDEHFYTRFEFDRDYEKDSLINHDLPSIFVTEEHSWAFTLLFFESRMLKMAKARKDKLIFNEMMNESSSIRRATVDPYRPRGWGHNNNKYRHPAATQASMDKPYQRFSDGDWFYQGKVITKEEAKKILNGE